MGRFNHLLGEAKEVKIGEDVFQIRPLTARYLDMFMDNDPKKQAEVMFNIITVSLQQTDESITVEDVKELPVNIFNEVAEVVMSVNELDKK